MKPSTKREDLRISTRVVYDEFVAQNIPVRIIDAKSSMIEYTDNAGEDHFVFSTSSDKSSAAGLNIANDKSRSEVVARNLSIPVPEDIICRTYIDVLDFFGRHEKVVLKPLANSGGTGVSTNIETLDELERAYTFARLYGPDVIAQEHMDGDDVRLLVVAGHFVSAVIRRPAHVTGDGKLTITALVAQENVSKHRNDDSSSSLMHIDVPSVERFLQDSVNDVPEMGEEVRVVGPGNVSLGGSLHEATNLVTEKMKADAEKITNKLRIDMCGVDMMWDQAKDTYALIEVNATPGIDIHNDPFSGTSSDAVTKYVKWLVS